MTLYGLDNYACSSDVRRSERLSKKRSHGLAFGLENSKNTLKELYGNKKKSYDMMRVDKDYLTFLSQYLRKDDILHPSLEKEDGCNDEDDIDPQYLMFLNKVRQDGNSYVLEVDANNGATLKYEAEDVLNGEDGSHPQRKSRNTAHKKKIEIATSKKEVLKNVKDLGNRQMEERQNVVAKKRSRRSAISYAKDSLNVDDFDLKTRKRTRSALKSEKIHIASASRNFSSKDVAVTQIKSTLKAVKVETETCLRSVQEKDGLGNSKGVGGLKKKEMDRPLATCVASRGTSSGQKFHSNDSRVSNVICKNHGKDHTVGDSHLVFLKKTKSKQAQRKTRSVVKREKMEIASGLKNVLSRDQLKNSKSSGRFHKKERKVSAVEKHLKFEAATPVSRRNNVHLGSRFNFGDSQIAETRCDNNGKNDTTDDSYVLFLNSLKQEKGCLVLKIGEDMVVYEEEKRPDPEIVVLDKAGTSHDGTCNPFVTSIVIEDSIEGDHWQCHEIPSDVQSYFRKNVMLALKKPYDQEEYEELLEMVQARKPVECHLQLRGRNRSYLSEKLGKSYLDWHSDLNQKFLEFESDRYKMLNLLRGFFFWLQNKCHDGSFQPWRDKLSLSMMPGAQ